MFTLSSISSGLELWLVNQTSICEYSESKVSKNTFCVIHPIIDQMIY